MKYHIEQACTIQRLAYNARWLRLVIHLIGSAALCAFGWGRGAAAIPTFLCLFAPLVASTLLMLRLRGEPRSYSRYIGKDIISTAHQIAAESHARHRDPRGNLRDAVWWFSAYVQNVTLAVALALAIDAWGGPPPIAIAAMCAMLCLTGIVNGLDLKMRVADALLTRYLRPEDAADAPDRPAEGS